MTGARKSTQGGAPSPKLRAAAEQQLARDKRAASPMARTTPAELVHELQVHQIELEMQNQELLRAHLELEESRDRYQDLYEFAPVGYFSLTTVGRVVEANLTGATMLGATRPELIDRGLAAFCATDRDVELWERHLVAVMRAEASPGGGAARKECELSLRRADGSIRRVRLLSVRVARAEPTSKASASERVAAIRTAMTDVTELRQVEQRQRWQSDALEAVDLGVLITDYNGVVQWINPAFRSLTGFSEPDAPGNHPGELMNSGKQARSFYREMWETILAGNVWRSEVVNRPKDGPLYAEEMTITPVRDEAGAITSFIAVKQDITSRKLIEESLRASRERLELAVQGSSDGIWDWNLASDDLYVSDRCFELLGFGREELPLTPASWAALVHPDDRPNFEESLRRHREERVPLAVEARLRTRSGEFRWFLTRGQAVWDQQGTATRLAGSFTDITPRRNAEAAVRESEERFRKLTQCAPVGIFETDEQGAYLFVSEPFCKLTGRQAPALLGRSWLETVLAEDRPRVEAAWRAMALEGKRFEIDYRLPLEGTAEAVLGTAASVRDAQGRVTGFVGTITDLTEQRKLQARLRLADRMISLGTMAAGVAHEINNPLAFIVSNVAFALEELARASSSPGATPRVPEVISALKDAEAGGERVRRIVHDLKTFSRADDAPVTLIDVERVLESCLSMANNEIRHRAQLTRRFSGLPKVEGNESRLGQVFLNLLVNAAQAIPAGRATTGSIEVTTRVEGDRAVVLIRDTGVGIAPEHLSRIFDPFFTTKPVGVGTGLGLAICHGIVTSMHGDISVESEVGKGTTFRVSLPIAVRRDDAVQQISSAAAVRRSRILVIDDEPLLLAVFKRTLSQRHDVVALASAAEALTHIAAGEQFDLILCDLMMPAMSGMALHAELSRTAPHLAARMVFMTGGAFTDEAQRFLSRVPNPRLDKPFDVNKLEMTLGRYLIASEPAGA